MNPGDTRSRPGGANTGAALNEGRGVNPGDTRRLSRAVNWNTTLNEGRGVNPGDTRRPRRRTAAAPPLNEGRGVNPGDTLIAARLVFPGFTAQRRPGREPRRHLSNLLFGVEHSDRSTKAGA